ncbi:MAG: hypothetical protein PHR00_02630 [Patescibacteria group bacterium]|nr:hypothetical protein [Patescibacteria group bacterium]
MELEHWLSKSQFVPEIKNDMIVSLKGHVMEDILKKIILDKNNYLDNPLFGDMVLSPDYLFEFKDIINTG